MRLGGPGQSLHHVLYLEIQMPTVMCITKGWLSTAAASRSEEEEEDSNLSDDGSAQSQHYSCRHGFYTDGTAARRQKGGGKLHCSNLFPTWKLKLKHLHHLQQAKEGSRSEEGGRFTWRRRHNHNTDHFRTCTHCWSTVAMASHLAEMPLMATDQPVRHGEEGCSVYPHLVTPLCRGQEKKTPALPTATDDKLSSPLDGTERRERERERETAGAGTWGRVRAGER